MSSDRKQDVVTKTVEDERIRIGVLRAAEELGLSPNEDEDEDSTDELDEQSADTDLSGSTVCCLNVTLAASYEKKLQNVAMHCGLRPPIAAPVVVRFNYAHAKFEVAQPIYCSLIMFLRYVTL